MEQTETLRSAVRDICKNSNLLCVKEVSATLGMAYADCLAALDVLVAAGEMRRTCAENGEPYYWVLGSETESPCS